ncbi:DUF4271 domain-containing protein [Arcicella aquatica]|uniref:DUF4271 domain-containing protein n=1 Tax=Arcicella aquatica TaxID=217141 RepID=A0ABU5QJJ1_9BACT|nr:DUF4271 domain-containing protein [Arcicella aquatica]MEA5256994.1 DUF4271 domain-containing protein [Arcicella aquatica]
MKFFQQYIHSQNPARFIQSCRILRLVKSYSFLRIAFLIISGYLFFIPNITAKDTVGPNNGYYLVHDYRDDWQVFDERYKAYVPYVRELHKDYNSFSLFCDIENYKTYKILYYSSKENYLFINASLQQQLPINKWVVLDVDSLQRVYKKTKLFLTIYGSNTNIEEMMVYVGNRISKTQETFELSESLLTIIPRDISSFQNFFVIGLFLLVGAYAFMYNYQPKSFERFFNPKDLLTISVRDDSFIVNKPFDLGNLLFVVNLSFTIGFIFMLVINEKNDLFSTSSILQEGETLGVLLSNFLVISSIIFGAYIFKYISLLILSNLYRLDKIINIHFFKIIQASSIFFLIVLIILTYSTISIPEITENAEKYLFFPISLFFIGRLALLYFTINKMTALKNLYLFSYLCIVELIPLIVGIRFAL